mgnify:CR=1 FL=1
MKLYLYELYKYAKSKYMLSIVAVLAVICLVFGGRMVSRNDALDSELLWEIYREYASDPKYYDDKYAEWLELYSQYEQAYIEYAKRGGVEPIPPENSFSPETDDRAIYDKLYYDVKRDAKYHAAIDAVISDASDIAIGMEYSGSTDSYTYRYQQQLIRIYSDLYNNVYIGFEDTRGWDTYLTFELPFLLALVGAALTAAFSMTTERQTGCYQILRTVRQGRVKLCMAKIFAVITVGSFLVLILQLVWFAVVAVGIGFGSPYNGIQAYEAFTYCPFNLTVLQYALLDFGLKWIVIVALSAVFMLISSMSDYISALLINAALLFCGLAVYSLSAGNPEGFLHLCNFVFFGSESLLRYHALNIAGYSISLWRVMLPALILSASVCYIFASVIYLKHGTALLKFGLKLPVLKRQPTAGTARSRMPSSLLGFEMYKFFCKKQNMAFISLYLIATAAICVNSLGILSSDDAKLLDYIDSGLYGEVSQDKFEMVAEEGIRIEKANSAYAESVDSYYRGDMTLDEFKPIADEKVYADSRKVAYTMLYEYSTYLSGIDSNPKPWFVFERGYDRLFSDAGDYLLILLCCYIGSAIVGIEYHSSEDISSFYPILLTLKRGRRPTFTAKLCCAAILSGGVAVYSYIIRLLFIQSTYGLNGFFAPLYSLSAFSAYPLTKLPISGYLILHFIYSVLTLTLLCLVSTLLSMILKKSFFAFIITVGVVFVPVISELSGLTLPEAFCIYKLINMTNLDCASNLVGLISAICVGCVIFVFARLSYAVDKTRA